MPSTWTVNIRRSHVSRGVLVAQHVRVRGHDGGSGLFGDAGRLRRRFALVHQLLRGVRDAFITRESGHKQGAQPHLNTSTSGSCKRGVGVNWPLLEGLLTAGVLLRLSVPVEVQAQFLRVFFIRGCEAQLHHSLIETHWTALDQSQQVQSQRNADSAHIKHQYSKLYYIQCKLWGRMEKNCSMQMTVNTWRNKQKVYYTVRYVNII